MIPVTKTYFPSIEKYQFQLERIWKNGWLTNRGELVKELEQKIQDRLLSVPLLIMNNGTVPLQIALKILAKGGEVITTPFSYVATTSSIIWEGCTPIFADIDERTFTIDVNEIRKKITNKTTCILATHVFGNPCDVEAIETLAKENNLFVIYDAAHCFGVTYKGKSLFNYGDMSTCSFHATKVFHTAEGGALFTSNPDWMTMAFQSHNFGHLNATDFSLVGINAKISELQAAMGLSMLGEMDLVLSERKAVVDFYLQHLDFSRVQTIALRQETNWNYSYFPVVFESEWVLNKVVAALAEKNVFPRRYFYPSLNHLPYISGQSCPISESISSRVLCLPLYVGLSKENLNNIVDVIHHAL
jgi:dTDP-4-amino-4,6-dideoxygalactose transaminase